MSYNGSGTFQINSAGQPVVTGTVISSTAFNALTADLATGLSTAITKDGQTTTTARVPFAQGISSTLVTDATSATTGSIITAGGISTQKALWVGTTSQLVGLVTAAAGISSTLVTDATSATTGSIITAGGISTQKALWVGTTSNFVGAMTGTTLALTKASAGDALTWTNGGATPKTGYLYSDSGIVGIFNTAGAGAGRNGIQISSTAVTLDINAGTNTAIFTSSGLGIGMTPSNILDITQTQNAASLVKLLNSSAGVANQTLFIASNGTNTASIGITGTGWTPTTVYRADGTYIGAGGAGGLTLTTSVAQPIYFAISNTEVARFDTSGNLKIGTTSATDRNIIYKAVSEGTINTSISDANQGSAFFYGCIAGAYNAAACAIAVPKNNSTGRSINAGGTINASGADYAEYMVKADGCGAISKGEIVGVDADGKLTDKFSAAHSFVTKSTDPSYVGGDTWGNDTLIGKHPQMDGKNEDETNEDYQARVKDFEAVLEKARAKVDRIAFSGQVPVNVTGATVGDYIVPVAAPDGGIAGEAVTNPTFDQYRAAVGRVWKILEDGRAFVSVKVS